MVLVAKVSSEKKSGGSLLYKFYERIDRRLFVSDALEPVNIADLFEPALVKHGSEQINEADLDLVINFASRELNAKLASAAKHGVWFYSFGDAPGVNEVMNLVPITVSSLRALKDGDEHVIYQSVSPTLSRFSVRLNNNSLYWKSASFVARGLMNTCERQNVNHSSAVATKPGNAAMSKMLLKLSGRAAGRAVEKLSTYEQWVLAYRINQSEFKYLIPPNDRFWADPFPVKAGGKYYIFFEEYLNSAGRAHLSVVEVDQNGITGGPTEVLKLDCHLSYPFVFEWQGEWYMIPETGEKNVVELYRAVEFPFKWKHEKVLLEANRPLDATLIEVDGVWWMYVNVQEEGVAVNWDELHLYYADSPLGPWKPHARNPVVSDVRSARPAGRLFWSKNVLYRPSQDSSLRYGYGTTISKVTKLSPSEYNETEVLKIVPDWDRDIIGVHTVNLLEEITVIDCLTKRSRFRSSTLGPPKRSLDLPFVG